ncbi:MAG: hypothetical protein HY516_03880 [Candidatus Aenigmarchaeota archaeon]|nr:hypothetical protein [Candidatus Aenigmarchaeota archaeon]
MPELCVYANRFSPRVRKGDFPTLYDADRYEREIENRWNELQQELTAESYKKTTRMPIKGIDHRSMGVYVERGEMSPDDPFTNFYGLVRYRAGQRVETFARASRSRRRHGPVMETPHYVQEEEVLFVTDNLTLALRIHDIMVKDLPAFVIADNLVRIRLRGFVEYMVEGHEVPVLETIVDLNPMVSSRGKPLITRVYGEGNPVKPDEGSDFMGSIGRN